MSAGRILVYGGRGALGSTCVDAFKAKNWWTCNVDLAQNDKADANIIVKVSDSWQDQANQITDAVQSTLAGEKLDAIFCVAGGWAGGNASSEDFVKSCDMMWKQSVWSSVIASSLASKFLKEGGLLQLTGASAAMKGTSFMMGYGMAKAAVHQLVGSLSSGKTGLPKNATPLAILPITLDTPMNRKNMPSADFSTWTPLSYVSDLFMEWASNPASRPASGSLVELVTKDGKSETKISKYGEH